MRIEKTSSYIRFSFGRHYFTWVKRTKDKQVKIQCQMIELAAKLNHNSLIAMRDYLHACIGEVDQ